MGRERSLKNLKRGGQPGRKPGVPNKVTLEVKEVARQLVERADYRETLARRLVSGRLAPAMETTLWHYAYGRPAQAVEVTTPDPQALRFIQVLVAPPTEPSQ